MDGEGRAAGVAPEMARRGAVSEESVVQAWLLGRLNLGIRMRVTQAGGARREMRGGEGADERAEAEDEEEDERGADSGRS